MTTELNPWDAYSPGRLDQHVYPFYKADVEAGILDDSRALELLGCLWVKFNNQPAPPKVGITLKESSTYTDFANINTGGITPEGQDGVNDVSYLILDCMDEMKLLQPSSNVQISRKTPQKFLKRACEISRKGWGQPAFYNTEAIIQELLNAGKSLEDARRGGTSGCVETGAFGNEAYIPVSYTHLDVYKRQGQNNGWNSHRGASGRRRPWQSRRCPPQWPAVSPGTSPSAASGPPRWQYSLDCCPETGICLLYTSYTWCRGSRRSHRSFRCAGKFPGSPSPPYSCAPWSRMSRCWR